MKKNVNLSVCFFASEQYWKNPEELHTITESMMADMADLGAKIHTILNNDDLDKVENGDILVAIPMSGAVQQTVINASKKFGAVCIYPGYIRGNFNENATNNMLILNAAPAVMDIFAVLKRNLRRVSLCLNRDSLTKSIKLFSAYFRMKTAKLLLVGDIEPWVISASRDLSVYKNNIGVSFEQIPLEAMINYYHEVLEEDARQLYDSWRGNAEKVEEPTNEDILNASRFCVALKRIIEDHNADGVAIACFNLLKQLGTTACLAVSYINNSTDYVAACEGDTDSAVTMLMLKSLTDAGIWMANPNIRPEGMVNFVHCTAPLNICGQSCSYILRNHHESGIGVSPQVDFPNDISLTACRVSDGAQKITILSGMGRRGEYEPSCRTQYTVKFDDFDKYIDSVLGCHQVFAFEDIADEMKTLSRMLELQII